MLYLFIIFGCVMIWGIVAAALITYIDWSIKNQTDEGETREDAKRRLRHWRQSW